jgi:hypothetical protein
VASESGESGDGGELAAAVADGALVVIEGGDRPLSEAFGIDGYPTYLQIEGGAVADVHPSMTQIPAPAAV